MKKIVVLGGGFAGIETVLRLRRLNKKDEILLINEDDCFAFIPALYETAAGELEESDVCILISALLNHRGIIYYHDTVEKIDLKKKTISTKQLKSIEYDALVMAVGAQTNYYGILGAQKFAFDLKTKADAEKIYQYIHNVLSKKQRHRFVICGAGLTGVEFASTLLDHIHASCKKLGCSIGDYSVTLAQSSGEILSGLPEKARKFALDYLKKKGAKVVTNFRVSKIGKNFVYSKKKKIPADMVVWAGGLKTHELIEENGFAFSGKGGERGTSGGGMLVNDFLQLKGHPEVFGCGDCIAPMDQKLVVAKTAQNAVHEAQTVAYNVNAFVNGKKLRKYRLTQNHFYCALGKNMGMLVEGQKVITGKKIREKKERLERAFVKSLRELKIQTKNVYG